MAMHENPHDSSMGRLVEQHEKHSLLEPPGNNASIATTLESEPRACNMKVPLKATLTNWGYVGLRHTKEPLFLHHKLESRERRQVHISNQI